MPIKDVLLSEKEVLKTLANLPEDLDTETIQKAIEAVQSILPADTIEDNNTNLCLSCSHRYLYTGHICLGKDVYFGDDEAESSLNVVCCAKYNSIEGALT